LIARWGVDGVDIRLSSRSWGPDWSPTPEGTNVEQLLVFVKSICGIFSACRHTQNREKLLVRAAER
jgi:hypothetical protein